MLKKTENVSIVSADQLKNIVANPKDTGYPEECCDPSEITDEEFRDYESSAAKGFWNAFTDNKNEKR